MPTKKQRADADFYFQQILKRCPKAGDYYGTASSDVLVTRRADGFEILNDTRVGITNAWDAARVLAGWLKFEAAAGVAQ